MMTSARNSTVAHSAGSPPKLAWILASLALSMLISSLGVSVANVALPTLAQAFTASFQQVQWVVISYLLVITITIVGVGRLGDIMGHRKVLLAGIFLFTVASILCAVAPSLWFLISARAIQGIGAAVLVALTMALVRGTIPKEKTGRAMGLLGTMSAIGTALGPSLGGILLSSLSWRAIFFIMIPLGILNFLLAYRYLPTQEPKEVIDRKSFDSLGTLLLGLTLAAYTLAVTVGAGQFEQLNTVLLMAAVLCGVLFIVVQKRVASPLIRLALFRNPVLSGSLAMNVLVSTVMMATLVVGPFYLSLSLGFKEAFVGIIMSIGPVISALSGFPAGRLVDRFGASFMVIIGLIGMITGSFALSVLPSVLGVSGYIVAIAILTPSYQLFQAANNTAVMKDITSNQRGVVSGMLSLSRNLGLITGASVMGAVFSFASMTPNIITAHPEAVASGMQFTFAIAGGLIILALAIALGSRVSATVHSAE